MRKFISVFDGRHFPKGIVSFLGALSELAEFKLTGVFLSPVHYSALWNNPLIPVADSINAFTPEVLDEADQTMYENMNTFSKWCETNNIPYRIHDDSGNDVFRPLFKESRFSDVLVVSSEMFYSDFGRQPNDYLKEIMHKSECPVLMIPENFTFPENIILAYDGSPSSVFAIKQFACLMPELCKKPATVLFTGETEKEIPDLEFIQELASTHFSDLNFNSIQRDDHLGIRNFINSTSAPLLVAGAFGRSGISMMMKKSFIADLISDNSLPIFLSHK